MQAGGVVVGRRERKVGLVCFLIPRAYFVNRELKLQARWRGGWSRGSENRILQDFPGRVPPVLLRARVRVLTPLLAITGKQQIDGFIKRFMI
jgi:hypothetical protein